MKKIYFACLLIFILSCATFAQNSQLAAVDKYIESEMQKQKIPGVALAIVKNGQIEYVKGYGFANVEHQVPVKADTVFQSGSVGKQFTSAAVMQLVEEGKINLDDKIGKYFKDAPAAWENITVRHLLTHTSGMTDYPKEFDFRRDYTEAELFEVIKKMPLAFAPGEKWSYSNLGYVTLGVLIGKVTGKFYGDFLQERLFKPLGMQTARVINENDIIPNRASGYVLVNGKLENQRWVSPTLNTTADGALYLTLADMAKWDAALYDEKLFKKESLGQMWTPAKLSGDKTHPYGFGWFLRDVQGSRLIEHGGAWQGFKSQISRYVDEKTSVIVFANLIQADIGRLAQGVAQIYNPKLAQIKAQAIEDKEPKVTAWAKDVLQQTIDATIKKELFTDEAQAALFPDRIKQTSENLKPLGKINKLELLESRTVGELRVYRYRAIFENESLIYVINLTKDDKIAGIGLRPE